MKKNYLLLLLLGFFGLSYASATTTLLSPIDGFNNQGAFIDLYRGTDFDDISGVSISISENGEVSSTGAIPMYAMPLGGINSNYTYNSIAVDGVGNTYLAGSFQNTGQIGNTIFYSSGGTDIFISKLDKFGQIIRAKKGGGVSNDEIRDVSVDSLGNIYIVGKFSGTGTFGNDILFSSGSGDLFISKLDTNGEFIWTKQVVSNDGGHAIYIDNSDYIYIVGSTYGKYFIGKRDSNGNTIRENTGNGSSKIKNLSLDSNGNVYVIGEFSSTGLDFGITEITRTRTDYNDLFVAKLDNDGQRLWAKGATGTFWDSLGFGIDLDSNGNIYIAGSFKATYKFGDYSLTSLGDYDVFVVKLDNDGNWLWATQGGGSSNGYGGDIGRDVVVMDNGEIYVLGYVRSNATFGSIPFTGVLRQLFLGKISSIGTWLSVDKLGGATSNEGHSFKLIDGTLNIVGKFNGVNTFSGSSISSKGSVDMFIWKYTSPINYKTQAKLPDGNYEWWVSVEDSLGNVEVSNTGNFTVDVCAGITTYAESDCKALVRIYKHFYSEESSNRRWNWLTNTTYRAGTQMTSNHVSQLRLQNMVMKNNNIPTGLFSGLTMMNTLDISYNSNLESIETGAFMGTPSLRSLYIQDNDINSISSLAFTGITLAYLSLDNNNLSGVIHPGIFDGLVGNNLTIRLSNSNISNLPSGVFSSIENLIGVSLYHNNITGMSGIFSGLSTLERFDLGGNPISEIPDNYFINEGILNLTDFYLSEANLTKIKKDTFSGLNNLQGIEIYANPITEIETGAFNGLDNLDWLYLNNLKIKTLTPGMFQGLGSSLTDLEIDDRGYDYLGLPAIIEEIAPGTFDNLVGLSTLTLAGNRIYSIPSNIFDNLVSLDVSSSRTRPSDNCIDTDLVFTHTGVQSVDRQSTQKVCPIISYNPATTTSGPVTGTIFFTGGDASDREILNTNNPDIISHTRYENGLFGFNLNSISSSGLLHPNSLIITGEVTWINSTPTDTESPTIQGIANGGIYTTNITFTATDNIGIASVTLDGNILSERVNKTISIIGTHTLVARDSANNTTTITFEIKASSSGGGGGGGNSQSKDKCPEGDYTSSYYDGKCGEKPKLVTGSINTGSVHGSAVNTGGLFNRVVDMIKNTIINIIETIKIPEAEEIKENITTYKNEETKKELAESYQFALEKGITTITKVEDAQLDGVLTREQMAKMVSNYIINVIGTTGTKYGEKECSNFSDLGTMNEEMRGYAIVSCQLGLMGQNGKGGFLKKFSPKVEVTRGQFGTILSRMLRGNKYNRDGGDWYKSHLYMLKKTEIMTNIEDPEVKELRGWVMVMMKRATDKYNGK